MDFSNILTRGTYGFFAFAAAFLLFFTIVLWIFLPIVVFKIRTLLDEANETLDEINKSVKNIEGLIKPKSTEKITAADEILLKSQDVAPPLKLKDEKDV